jgi:hypothetical protein
MALSKACDKSERTRGLSVHPSSLLSVRQPSSDLKSPTCIDVPIRPGVVLVPRFRKAESLGENSARRRCRG